MSARDRVARVSREYRTLWASIGRGSSSIAFGTATGQVFVLLALPLVARLYGPAAVGAFALYASAVTLLGTVATLRYEVAIALPDTDDRAWLLVQSCFALARGFSIVLLLGVGGLVLVVRWTSVPWHPPLLVWLVPFGVFLYAGAATLSRWMIRSERYAPVARARSAQGLVSAVSQPVLGLVGKLVASTASSFALVVGDLMARTAALFTLAKRCRPDRDTVPLVRSGIHRDSLARYRSFALAGLPANVMNIICLQLPVIVIALTYGPATTGEYALIQKILLGPTAVITSAITFVLVRQSAIRREERGELRRTYLRVSQALAVLGLPLLVLAFIDVTALVSAVFGPSWVPAARILRIVAPLYYVNLVITPWGAALDAMERQGLFLVREGVRLVCLLAAAILVYQFVPSPMTGIAVMSWVGIATYVFYGFVCASALSHPRNMTSAPASGTASVLGDPAS